jgi:hypothetical protein
MRNRRLLWCLVAGVVLLLAGFTVFVVVHVLPDRITPENVERIRVGETTEGEVRALLGGPPDIEVPGSAITIDVHNAPDPAWEKIWVGQRWAAQVQFDDSRRVLARACAQEGREGEAREFFGLPELTFWQKLRRSLGW